MAEGLSPSEVGKEIGEHRGHAEHGHAESPAGPRPVDYRGGAPFAGGGARRVLGLRGGQVEHRGLGVAGQASAARTKANRANLEGLQIRTLDSVSFNAWFTAFTAANANAERLAERRLRPGYRPAFYAWLATDPAHNPDAPPGPSYMPQYVIPQEAAAGAFDKTADANFAKGSKAGATGDKYVRDTVFLATVLFLVGISGHFPLRQARYGLDRGWRADPRLRRDPAARPPWATGRPLSDARFTRVNPSPRGPTPATGRHAMATERRLAARCETRGLLWVTKIESQAGGSSQEYCS